jgi:hypothetical protein
MRLSFCRNGPVTASNSATMRRAIYRLSFALSSYLWTAAQNSRGVAAQNSDGCQFISAMATPKSPSR